MSDKLSPEEVEAQMKKVPEWENEDKAISREVEFDEFMEAIDFVNSVAEIADEANHHPDIDIRFTTVTVRLTTHSSGGLTQSDFEVGGRIDNLLD